MDKHKFNIFPEMQTEDYIRLKSDIQANGYDIKQPIWIYEGQILDGWNRQRACNELGVTPAIKNFLGDEIEAVQFVMRTNKRRNLTSSQWACIAGEATELIDAIKEAIETERIKKLEGNKNASKEKTTVQLIVPSFKDTSKLETAKTAEIFNTNRTYVSEARKLRDENPEIFEQVKSGKKTIPEVKKEQKIEKRKAEIEEIKAKIEAEPQTVDGLFDVVAIDPPWAYGREYNPETSRVANPYPEMLTDEIAKIELPLKDDAVVFLWTTHAFIQDAFYLLKNWGLNYKAVIVWDKERMGMGATIRMQCEFCLLATKGKPILQGASERDIIREARREHSRKPEAFYSMVDRLCIGRKLDYFSREEKTGWTSYGAETQKF